MGLFEVFVVGCQRVRTFFTMPGGRFRTATHDCSVAAYFIFVAKQ